MNTISNNSSIADSFFERSGFKEIFSKDNYKKNSSFAIQFLIALNQSNETIKNYIDKMQKEKKDRIDAAFSSRALTPLHLAVLKNNREIAEKLIAYKADVNKRDAQGWTPMHYAALFADGQMLSFLEERGGKRSLIMHLGATVKEIRMNAGSEESNHSRQKLFIGEEEKAIPCDFSLATLNELGLLDYMDIQIFPLEMEVDNVKEEFSIPSLIDELEKKRESLSHSAPLLRIGKDSILEKAKIADRSTRSLFAFQGIEKGAPIGVFGGRLQKKPAAQNLQEILLHRQAGEDVFNYSKNLQLDICPESVGNAMRFINDGFPNAFSIDHHALILASEKIEKGERIAFDYDIGAAQLKWGKYLLIRKEAMADFFRQTSPERLWEEITSLEKEKKMTFQKFVALYDKRYKFWYPFQTPAALIYLSLTNVVQPSAWLTLLKKKEVQEDLDVGRSAQHFWWIGKTLWILDGLSVQLTKLDKIDRPLGNAIRQYFLKLQSEVTIPQLIKGLEETRKYMGKYNCSTQEGAKLFKTLWENTLKDELTKSLPHYSWEKDQSRVLGYFVPSGESQGQIYEGETSVIPLMKEIGII